MISGALHYFRVHPEQWAARLASLHHLGLDTIETYVPWNLHEPVPGTYDFEGIADLGRFLELVDAEGLRAIVRPGPYICAEWENGGLPAWLTGRPGLRPRTSDPDYLAAVDAWFDVLIPLIAARQGAPEGSGSSGTPDGSRGPVAMVQVENEYGSYGGDAAYLEHLRSGLVARGITVPLVTSDGPTEHMLAGGTLPGVRATVNFGSRPDEAFDLLARLRPDDEPFCMEYWNGWFDHWGTEHHVRDAADAADVLDRMLARGASVNLYMAHGGTSFGCTAGANHDPERGYQPTVTSYDYDAPVDESGRPTAKLAAYREVIARHRPLPDVPLPEPAPRLAPTTVRLPTSLELGASLDRAATVRTASSYPLTFEELGLTHGIVRHRTRLTGPRERGDLTLPGLADRAHVYVDGRLLGIVDRDGGKGLELEVGPAGVDLEIRVESMGRVNYGPLLGERKGLVGGVRHHGQFLHGWDIDAFGLGLLPAVPDLPWGSGPTAGDGPGWRRGTFEVAEPGDAFLALAGWAKGYVWVNGFCLGRYWDRGPQATLYVPAPVLRAGVDEPDEPNEPNEIVVLELDGNSTDVVEVRAEPELG